MCQIYFWFIIIIVNGVNVGTDENLSWFPLIAYSHGAKPAPRQEQGLEPRPEQKRTIGICLCSGYGVMSKYPHMQFHTPIGSGPYPGLASGQCEYVTSAEFPHLVIQNVVTSVGFCVCEGGGILPLVEILNQPFCFYLISCI